MAWKETHKLESRQRILEAAAKLFTGKGFNQVGINDVMQAAGMTRGAFYAHFNSKIELYEEAIYYGGKTAAQHFSKETTSLADIIDNYLSQEHMTSSYIRCPMSCLVSDVAHDDERVKHIYTNLLKGFTEHLGKFEQENSNEEHQLLQTVLLIGGMALARSITDEKLSKKILLVCANAAKNISL